MAEELAAAKNTEEFAAEQEVLERAAEAEENKVAAKPVAEELAAAEKAAAEQEEQEAKKAEENKEAAVAKNVPSALEKRWAELNEATKNFQQANCTEKEQARDDVRKLARRVVQASEEDIRLAQKTKEEATKISAKFCRLNPNAPEFLQNTAGGPAQQDSRSGASGSWQDRAARADPRNNTKSTL